MAIPLYFDTDPGVDDALALAYLLHSSEVDLVGIGSVSGNIDAATAAQNALDLLAVAGRPDIPVAVGAHDPRAGRYAGGARHVHGPKGIGEVELPRAVRPAEAQSAAEMIVELARRYPGELRILAVGPLTNLALALDIEPALPALVRDVVIMGGAAGAPGNVTPVAEANIYNDPEAATLTFAAPWQIILAPLDVTMEHRFEESDRRALSTSQVPLLRVLGDMLGYYFAFYGNIFGHPCCALHDPLAAALACETLATSSAPVLPVVVDDSNGPGRGQTIVDLRGERIGYPLLADAHAAVVLELAEPFAPHLLERLLAGPTPAR